MRERAWALACAFFLASASISISTQAFGASTADDVNKAAETLKKAIDEYGGASKDVQAALGALRRSMFAKKVDSADPQILIVDMSSLTARLGDVAETDIAPRAVYEASAKLRAAISQKIDTSWPVDAFKVQSKSLLDNILNPLPQRFQISKDADARAGALSMLDSLSTLDNDTVAQKQFVNLVGKLTTLIKNADNRVRIGASLTADPGTADDKAVKDARTEFENAYRTLTDALMIHVISSRAGDIGRHPRRGRTCTSTNAVMTKCERHDNCSFDAKSNDAASIDLAKLCGFDPVPFADASQRGVKVEYACVRGGQDVWEKLAKQPKINPASGASWKPEEKTTATLQSPVMSLRCPFPVSQTTGSAK